ncbi:(2Fe-2S)-binding protein [Kitasatospora sp. NBC_01250]|uniref:(2Fe-2S)-binding protein n=1 Tax=Kitasatospora sp. NBC_01250 TaxID=2903571 RepID=UPI003FA598AE
MATDPTNHPVALGDGRPTTSYTLRVNGFERPVTDAWIGESLLYVLRERLGLAGAKNGCEQGECGACSVQVDGQLVAGCLVPAALAADSEINTVEGLSAGGAASDVQQALAESGAVQCGYCTPGMAMAVHDLLQRNHRPSEVEARQALCGNLCRCTGYRSVLAAVQTVADARGAALLEAEQAAEQAAGEAGAAPAPAPDAAGPQAPLAEPAPLPAPDPVAQAAPVAPVDQVDPPVYQDAWTETATTGEVPLFGSDGSGWITADPLLGQQPPAAEHPAATAAGIGLGVIPNQGYSGYDPTAYGPGTVYDGGSSYEPTPAHGTAAPGAPYEGTPAHGTPYEPTPPHGVPYDATPAHGTAYPAAPPYAAGPYAQAPYPGVAYDGVGYQGTPAHGVPAPGTPFDGTVYETAPGMPEAGTPAHGLLLPEDDHA